jgi:hypothetical protein
LPADAALRTSVALSIEFGGQPFVFGEPNALPLGGTLLPTNFRFYVSEPALLQAGEPTRAFLVDSTGAPLPYGVQLVNAEDPASFAFDIAAPPGTYDGLSFLLGLSHGCNTLAVPGKPPLDEAAQLKWPHTLGFLFLRYEGQRSEDADPTLPTMIHMGAAAGDQGFAPRIELALAPAMLASEVHLSLSFDALLEAATTETDLSDFELLPPAPPTPGEEILAGERLRRAATSVELFRVVP